MAQKYYSYGPRFEAPLSNFYISYVSKKPLPEPIQSEKCASSFPVCQEHNIIPRKKYDIVLGDPRFLGLCELLTKKISFSRLPRTIPDNVIRNILRRIANEEEWWCWLRPDGSWLLADARCTALAKRVRSK